MNYYPFHVGDYAAHTAHLEPMEDLAYRRLLDLYYLREQPIPREPEDAARLIRMRANVSEVAAVLVEFFDQTPEGWRHGRCDAELAKMQDKQAKARTSAEASVNARKASAQRTLNERSTNAELPTPTPTPRPTVEPEQKHVAPVGATAGRFEDFWAAYPDKTGKKPALEKWKAKRLDVMAGTIVADVLLRKAQHGKWLDGFVPNPATYLQQERWNDPIVPRGNARAGPQQPPGKTVAGFFALDAMANPRTAPDEHARPAMVRQPDRPRLAAPTAAEPGSDPGE